MSKNFGSLPALRDRHAARRFGKLVRIDKFGRSRHRVSLGATGPAADKPGRAGQPFWVSVKEETWGSNEWVMSLSWKSTDPVIA